MFLINFSKKDEKLFKIMWKLLIKKISIVKCCITLLNFLNKTFKKTLLLKSENIKIKIFPFITNKNHKKRIKGIIESI